MRLSSLFSSVGMGVGVGGGGRGVGVGKILTGVGVTTEGTAVASAGVEGVG